jgi:hypothetical protein
VQDSSSLDLIRSNTRAFEGREDAIRIDGTQGMFILVTTASEPELILPSAETSKDEIKRIKALVNERKTAFRASHGLTIKAATEKAKNSLTPAERRLIETSTHGKRSVGLIEGTCMS